MFVCACVRVRACAGACVCARARARVCVCVCVCVCVWFSSRSPITPSCRLRPFDNIVHNLCHTVMPLLVCLFCLLLFFLISLRAL